MSIEQLNAEKQQNIHWESSVKGRKLKPQSHNFK